MQRNILKPLFFSVFLLFSSLTYSQEVELTDSNIVGWADWMPSFPGGDNALLKYLSDSLRMPEEEKNLSGTIYLSCVIDTLGKVRNVSIIKGIKEAPLTSKEAIRLVSTLPNFKPARDFVYHDGQKVNLKYNIPVALPAKK